MIYILAVIKVICISNCKDPVDGIFQIQNWMIMLIMSRIVKVMENIDVLIFLVYVLFKSNLIL